MTNIFVVIKAFKKYIKSKNFQSTNIHPTLHFKIVIVGINRFININLSSMTGKLLAFVAILATTTSLFGQQRNCGSMDYLQQQINDDPQRAERLQAIEEQTAGIIAQQGVSDRAVYTIPVVVHVIWNTSAENISDAQVQSQIDVLNEDFRRLNADATNTWGQAADSEVEFCLASVDPNGTATTGITRRQTTVSSFSTNDNMKFFSSGGTDAWPTGDYLNIWVCDLSNGLLGYAQFPGGPANTDGVVVDYAYFGRFGTATPPFNLGRTATHEVGHWLNLRHIWGDGNCNVDDFVSDTPNSDAPNYSCPTGHVSCSSTDMIENYMDYTDDGCMNLFTQGQKSRMRALFAPGGPRASLLSSNGCAGAPTCGVPGNLGTNSVTNTSATASWNTTSGAINYDVEIAPGGSGNWTTYTTSNTSYTFNGLTACTGYDVRVAANCSSSSSSFSGIESFTTSGCSGGCQDTEVTLTLVTDNYGNETTWELLDANGSSIASGGPYANNSTYTQTFCLADGCYDYTIFDSYGDGICCAYGAGSYQLVDENGNVLASGGQFGSVETTNICIGTTPPPPPGCSDNYEPNESRNQSAAIATGTTIQALIDNATDDDWYQFNNTSSQRDIQILLSNLPADYDVRLYRNNRLVGISQNPGTQDEEIIYNTNRVSNYYIWVYGYNGANDPANCYNLVANISATNFRGMEAGISLAQVEKNLSFAIAPNPAPDQATLLFAPFASGNVDLRVSDLSGKVVLRQQINLDKTAQTYKLNVSNYAPGIYLVTAKNNESVFTQKLLIQR